MSATTRSPRQAARRSQEELDAGNDSSTTRGPGRAARIADLAVGECMAEAKRLVIDDTNRQEVDDAIASLKSTMSKAASRASDRTGHKYMTEVGQFFTRFNDIIVTAVVTRTE